MQLGAGKQGGGTVGWCEELQSEAWIPHLPAASIPMTFLTQSKDFYPGAGLTAVRFGQDIAHSEGPIKISSQNCGQS